MRGGNLAVFRDHIPCDLVSLGLQVRTQNKLKVRQPLRAAHVILSKPSLEKDLAGVIGTMKEELNVLDIHFVPMARAREFVEYQLKPNFRSLGQKGRGKDAQMLKGVMAKLGVEQAATLNAQLLADGKITVEGIELVPEDVEVAFTTKEGFAAAGARVGVVALETALDDHLRELGFLRELQSRGLEYEEIQLDEDPGFRQKVFDLTGNWTVPQILIDGEPIGGYTELWRLDRDGRLERRLAA
jgi:isoleucyl-tRNA synthetase